MLLMSFRGFAFIFLFPFVCSEQQLAEWQNKMLQGSSWSLKLIIKSSRADVWLWSHASKCACFTRPCYSQTLICCQGSEEGSQGCKQSNNSTESFPVHHQNQRHILTTTQQQGPTWPSSVLTSPSAFVLIPQGNMCPFSLSTSRLWSPQLLKYQSPVDTPVIKLPFLHMERQNLHA